MRGRVIMMLAVVPLYFWYKTGSDISSSRNLEIPRAPLCPFFHFFTRSDKRLHVTLVPIHLQCSKQEQATGGNRESPASTVGMGPLEHKLIPFVPCGSQIL